MYGGPVTENILLAVKEREDGYGKSSTGTGGEDAATDWRRPFAEATDEVHHSLGPCSHRCSIPRRPKGLPSISSIFDHIYSRPSISVLFYSLNNMSSFYDRVRWSKQLELLITTSISGDSIGPLSYMTPDPILLHYNHELPLSSQIFTLNSLMGFLSLTNHSNLEMGGSQTP